MDWTPSLLRPHLARLSCEARKNVASHDGPIASHDYRLEWRARLRFHFVGRGVSRREIMGTLVFVCPTTGAEVSTGIEMDVATLHKLELSKVFCPHCRQQHQMAGIPNWLAMGGTAREHVLRGCESGLVRVH